MKASKFISDEFKDSLKKELDAKGCTEIIFSACALIITFCVIMMTFFMLSAY